MSVTPKPRAARAPTLLLVTGACLGASSTVLALVGTDLPRGLVVALCGGALALAGLVLALAVRGLERGVAQRLAEAEARLATVDAARKVSELQARHGEALGKLAAKLVRRRYIGRLGAESVETLAATLGAHTVALVHSAHALRVEHAVGLVGPAEGGRPLPLPEHYTAPSEPLELTDPLEIERMLGGLRPQTQPTSLLVAPVPARLGRSVLVVGIDRTCGAAELAFVRTVANMLGAAKSREVVEAELRQAQKLEAVGQLAGSVAHDFNNLLSTILAGAQLAALRAGRESEAARVLEDVTRAAEHAAVLTRQLLSFTRSAPTEAAVLDLGAVLDDLGGLLTRIAGENVELAIETSNYTVPIFADRTSIEQLLFNLVSNARDAIASTGTVTIIARRALRTNPALAELIVADDGRGMTPEVRDRIFDPFFTTKSEGTGLGLATVRRVVRELQGTIQVASTPNEGTVFTLRFPMVIDAERQSAGQGRTSSPLVPLRLLLVDDNEMARRSLSALLGESGHRVVEAEDGVDALEHLDRGLEVDLIVADVVMPRLSGAALVGELRRRAVTVPVVLMTGYTDSEFDEATLAQASGLLYKPFRHEELEALISHAVARAAGGAHAPRK